MHLLPEFNKEVFAGKRGSELRNSIESYDFDCMHAECKSSGMAVDPFLYGSNEMALLMWSGDIEAARAGWRKQIEARKKIAALVQKGERAWGEYQYEELIIGSPTVLCGLLAAGEMSMARELIPHSFMGTALRDPLVAAEMEQTVCTSAFSWQGPNGYINHSPDTFTLQARAFAAVVDDGEVDVEALRAWLPRPDALVHIAEHEFLFVDHWNGAAHPAMLCATLYARQLGAWDDAEAIVNGILAIAPMGDGKGLGMQPLVRIEAWRLLARCRGARGDAAGACEALESAESESEAVGYVWMQAAALRDMLGWVEADGDAWQRLQERVGSVTSQFCVFE